MSNVENFLEREEIEMLLPWYVTGKLDAADRAKVDAYLMRDPDMRRQLTLIRDEQTASISANEAIVAPRTLSIERGMRHVAAHTSLGTRQAARGLVDRLRAWFEKPTPKGVRYAALAVAGLFLVQAIAIGTLVSRSQTYTTASAPGAADGATVIVKFVDGASAQSITTALDKLAMSIVDGPKPGGTFVVRIGAASISPAERQARISALRQATGVIGLVLP